MAITSWVTNAICGTSTNSKIIATFNHLGYIYNWSFEHQCYICRRTGKRFIDKDSIIHNRPLEWHSKTALDPDQSMPFYRELRLEVEDWLKDIKL